jgi:ADP-ribosyl-[dinitrogen reductase] hydrolase
MIRAMDAPGDTMSGHQFPAEPVATPLPESIRNCYWVIGGRLLAGMHPWSESRSGTLARLRELKTLGIDVVIDLTEGAEVSGYGAEYPTLLASFGITHQRFGLPDHGVPADPGAVTRALDAIDAALDAGQRTYVHCRAGIGRTGLMIGCWLARHGPAGEAAYARLNSLWGASRLASTWPRVPETDTQIRYLLDWTERLDSAAPVRRVETRERVAITRLQRVSGALLGMAIAEAIALDGAQSGEPADARAGLDWGGNTAMMLMLAESLLARGGNDPADQMRRYLEWQRHGRPSSTGEPMGVPEEMKRALAHWQWTGKPVAGSHDPQKNDPHTLPRCAAAALYFARDAAAAIHESAESSRTTQQSPLVLDACRVMAVLVLDTCAGVEIEKLLTFTGPAGIALPRDRLKTPVARLVAGEWRRAENEPTRATAHGVLTTALRVLNTRESFETGVRRVIAGCADAVTAAATYGALAGALTGARELPAPWLTRLRQRTLIESVAQKLEGRA